MIKIISNPDIPENIEILFNQQLHDWKAKVMIPEDDGFFTSNLSSLGKSQSLDVSEISKMFPYYFSVLRNACEKRKISSLVDTTLSDRQYFYNMTKIILLIALSGSKYSQRNYNGWIEFFCNFSIYYRLNTKEEMEILLNFLSGRQILNFMDIDKWIEMYLTDVLLDDYAVRSLNNDYKSKYKGLDDDYIICLYKNFVSSLATSICYNISKACGNKELEGNIQQLEQMRHQIDELSQKYEHEKKRADAFAKSYMRLGWNSIVSDEQSITGTMQTEQIEEYKKQIARLNTTICELERYNSKLLEKNKQIVPDKPVSCKNNSEVEKENDLDDAIRNEIDCTAKFAFALLTDQKFELEDELKRVYPNCVIINNCDQVNTSIELTIFMTNIISHSTYSGIKKKCKNLNIPYIHCPSMNIKQIERYIWNYYNS